MDSNHRLPAPEAGALTRLRYTPMGDLWRRPAPEHGRPEPQCHAWFGGGVLGRRSGHGERAGGAAPGPGRQPRLRGFRSVVARDDIGVGPQGHLEEDRLAPGVLHRVDRGGRLIGVREERAKGVDDGLCEREQVAEGDERAARRRVGAVLSDAVVAPADLELPGEPGVVVVGRRGSPRCGARGSAPSVGGRGCRRRRRAPPPSSRRRPEARWKTG